jgi:hypothetical protein
MGSGKTMPPDKGEKQRQRRNRKAKGKGKVQYLQTIERTLIIEINYK